MHSKNIRPNVEVTLYHDQQIYDPTKSQYANSENFILKPNPILALDRIVGMHPRHKAD